MAIWQMILDRRNNAEEPFPEVRDINGTDLVLVEITEPTAVLYAITYLFKVDILGAAVTKGGGETARVPHHREFERINRMRAVVEGRYVPRERGRRAQV
jgi:hypothetical protein